MPARLKVILLSIAATVCCVEIFVISILGDLIHWLVPDRALAGQLVWGAAILSSAGFLVFFYRQFSGLVRR
jgi:hypothetical protein